MKDKLRGGIIVEVVDCGIMVPRKAKYKSRCSDHERVERGFCEYKRFVRSRGITEVMSCLALCCRPLKDRNCWDNARYKIIKQSIK
jgi:hypothetical protein